MMGLVLYRAAYFLQQAGRNIRRSPFLTAVSVCTIAVSLILIGFFGYLLVHGYALMDELGRDLQMTVTLTPDVGRARAEALRDEVARRPDVESVTLLSAAEDRARNRRLLSEDLIAGLDEDSLPGSPALDVVLTREKREREDFDELAGWLASLQEVQGVEDIHFAAERFRVLYSVLDIAELIGILICGVILFAAVFFTFSTIKLTVYARADEIEVLRLVGATNGFIRAPFYLEGIVQGLLGSTVALLIVGVIHLRIQQFIQVEQAINFDLDLLTAGMVLWFLAGGTALGLAGSAFSVGRHLKV